MDPSNALRSLSVDTESLLCPKSYYGVNNDVLGLVRYYIDAPIAVNNCCSNNFNYYDFAENWKKQK